MKTFLMKFHIIMRATCPLVHYKENVNINGFS
jgi:hypothetical protein